MFDLAVLASIGSSRWAITRCTSKTKVGYLPRRQSAASKSISFNSQLRQAFAPAVLPGKGKSGSPHVCAAAECIAAFILHALCRALRLSIMRRDSAISM